VGFGSGPRSPVLTFQNRQLSATSYGYQQKVLWVVEPGYSKIVRVRLTDFTTGRPMWLQVGGGSAAASHEGLLDPAHPLAEAVESKDSRGVLLMYPSYLFIPKAACYVLEASWPDGAWTVSFSAGR
jgi:hypothetical protein